LNGSRSPHILYKEVPNLSKQISAGVIGDLANLVNALSRGVDTVFRTLNEWGAESVQKRTTAEEGVKKRMRAPDGVLFDIEINPDGNGTYSVSVRTDDGGFETLTNVLDHELSTAINVLFDDAFGWNVGEDLADTHYDFDAEGVPATASTNPKRMQVTLQRVVANGSDTIDMTNIFASYDSGLAVEDLLLVLNDSGVIGDITAEPTTFEIIPDTDSVGVEVVPEFDMLCACSQLICSTMTTYTNLKDIHWNLKGSGFREAHEHIDYAADTVLEYVDFFGELCVELCGTAPNPGNCIVLDRLLIPSNYTEQTALAETKQVLLDCATDINLYYTNFSHDIQSKLDDMIRYLSKEANYFTERGLD